MCVTNVCRCHCIDRLLGGSQYSLPAYRRVTNFCYIFGRRNGGRLIRGKAYTWVYTVDESDDKRQRNDDDDDDTSDYSAVNQLLVVLLHLAQSTVSLLHQIVNGRRLLSLRFTFLLLMLRSYFT